ncbi:MAG TPA: hypothetical protein VFZ21_07970, partial [Gemmatimonadaceae bacterium]|nr:hypothetical protein [Gemmatimonadaceae bacterium]
MPVSSPRSFLAGLVPATIAAIAGLSACSPRREALPPGASMDTSRVERVVGGLLPSVEVVNRPPVRWTLGERMAHYSVPGVSVAVI